MPGVKPQHHEIDVKTLTPQFFATLLDHSFLKTFFTFRELDVFCDDMKNYHSPGCSSSSEGNRYPGWRSHRISNGPHKP